MAKEPFMKDRIALLFTTSLLGLSLGCDQAGDAADTTPPSAESPARAAAADTIDGKLVATVELSATHHVEFWQFSDGAINLRELGGALDRDKKIDLAALAPLSAVDQFKRLAGSNTPVPPALSAAMAVSVPAKPGGPVSAPPPAAPSSASSAAVVTRSLVELAAIDWNADAAWWTQNFCSTAGVDNVWCPTNLPWADGGTNYATYYEADCLAASQNQSARFTTKYWNGSGWTTNAVSTVAPRTWMRWTANASNYYTARCESINTGGDSRIDFSQRSTWGAPVCNANPTSDMRAACCYTPIRDAVPADGDQDGLFDRCEDALAQKFAPIVYHSSDESNYPVNVDWFLPKTNLYFYDDACTPDWYGGLKAAPSQWDLLAWNVSGGCGSSDTVYSNGTRSESKQRTFFLMDVAASYRRGSLNSSDWRTYVHAFPNDWGGITVQYWREYAYNDAANDHGGDWEGEFVLLDSNLNPGRVILMGHDGIANLGPGSYVWEGNHVRVFSEGGGHATHETGSGIYAVGCSGGSPCSIDPNNQATNVRQETWNGGTVRWTNGSTSTNGGLLNVGEKIHPLNNQVFIQYSGIWGSPGTFFGTSGYWGPAYNETAKQGNFMTAWCYGRINAPTGECTPNAVSR
jgi:hypothetical protein